MWLKDRTMKLKEFGRGLGRFFGYALLLEAALLLIVGVIALIIGVRTWESYGTALVYGGLVAIAGGMAANYSDRALMGSSMARISQDQFRATTDLLVARRKNSGNELAYALLMALVGGTAIAIGLTLSGA
jgi:hypothetical protein